MITRKIRIDLSHFDSDWAKINNNEEDCYILLKSAGLDEIMTFQKGLEKLMEKDNVSSIQIFDKMEKFITSRFIGGMIYDLEIKKCRGIEKDEIRSFDLEVLGYIIGKLTGQVEKKG